MIIWAYLYIFCKEEEEEEEEIQNSDEQLG